jgi:hypothetical protein|tara:strand:- start:117 stop:626 length:510 start_codon:yes stop_codon:yes gene_type:complete
MTEEYNFKNLCNLTTKMMGFPDGSLAHKSRKRPLQVARAVAAYIGRSEEDIHRSIIAKVLNRDRSLIYHYEHTHKGNYATCIIYRNTFNKVYRGYKDMGNTKMTFLDDDFLKRHLIQSGVRENDKAQVFLEIKSGDSMCIIKTSYFDFSNQLENVKFALKNYHYSIKII